MAPRLAMRWRGQPWAFLLLSAVVLTGWQIALWLFHFSYGEVPTLAKKLYLTQDFPVLLAVLLAMVLGSTVRWGEGRSLRPPSTRTVGIAIVALALIGWAGHYLVFEGYVLSRDEQMAQFAGHYLAEGRLGVPVPPQWADFVRAIVPQFISPFGADRVWSSIYLPVGSLLRAAFLWLGNDDLTGPVLTAVGLAALWRVAREVFPDRPDAVGVVMLMALSSAQILTMSMSAYAAVGHFAFDMVWMALVLRGGRLSHGLAGLVAIAAMGLHQWHFFPLFAWPFLLWFVLQRRWAVTAWHVAAIGVGVVFWIRGWPMILEVVNGAAPPSAPPPRASIEEKVVRLFTRVGTEALPLPSLARFMAWNNILLLPLAALALPRLWQRWGYTWRGKEIVLPLVLVFVSGAALMLNQIHGWGYRYLHGALGPMALLAGFGWLRLSDWMGSRSLKLVWASCALALASLLFLLVQTHRLVAPYARAYAEMEAMPADIVLLDGRGGLYANDMVRFDGARPSRPVIMDIGNLTVDGVDKLCRAYKVTLYDRRGFWPLGMTVVRFDRSPKDHNQAQIDHARAIGCID